MPLFGKSKKESQETVADHGQQWRPSTTSVDRASELEDGYAFYPDPLSRHGSLERPGRSPGGSTIVSPTADAPLLKDRGHQQQQPQSDQPQYSSYYARQAMQEAEEDMHRGPQALFDPKERAKKNVVIVHRPVFLWIMSLAQLVSLIYSLVLNQKNTGSIIQTSPIFNYMVGPAPGVLITMGARFVPCMRNMEQYNTSTIFVCPAGIPGSITSTGQPTTTKSDYCSLTDICGFGDSVYPGKTPNQWYRFLMPMLLHAGVVHFTMNMVFQVRQGIQMERDYGWWRMAAIYCASAIGGFIFGANYAPLTPSVGCSGAVYGLMACLLLDLFQNWRLIRRPYLEVFKMLFQIVISLLIGTFPSIDNFAHVGGFYCGLIAGLIFMPTVHFSKWDKWRKRGLMMLAVPGLVLIYVFLVKGFYDAGENTCPWCKYFNCIPGMPWCKAKWGETDEL